MDFNFYFTNLRKLYLNFILIILLVIIYDLVLYLNYQIYFISLFINH